ncbi:MAG: hypothetical protein M2R45_01353 [Verrucomicrobia subdivision 3 bacterium]|nr:hypothetical protein [Limisphaerales bacterium]MCS1416028.1 hypothetical protein [Limisphaerales bacterium]
MNARPIDPLNGISTSCGRFRPAARVVALLVVAALIGMSLGGRSLAASAIDFNREIRPLLSDRCFFCHGPDAEDRKADLRLDLESSAKANHSSSSAIVPWRPDLSEMVVRITAKDPEDRMPPEESGKALTESEVALIKRWIAEGAVWSQHWAYQTPIRKPVPPVNRGTWPRNWIDHWVLARLESNGLEPSLDANPTTLVRRLSFDLVGLPPTREMVSAFVAAPTPQAYQRLIDSLLESPQFGERLAAYWLDLVRYADTVGYHGDQDHNISPYRDYVIDAFNDNLPFDQFTREQLAGDLLLETTIDQRIATGYNRLLQTSHEGGVQPKEYLAIYGADRVRNVSSVWLGATMGCAQCHDHKYDPITSKDFYAMQAFFADVDETRHFKDGTNDLPTRREPEIEVLSRRERQVLALLEREIEALEARPSEPEQTAVSDRMAWLRQMKDRLSSEARKVMVTQAVEPRTVRLLPRGNWLDESGPVVKPAVPEFLGRLMLDTDRRVTRLDLANWLTDSESGIGLLTARVFANRLWFLMFGGGLSRSLDDFGGQGEPPLHGELLDQLAIEFVESGWDIKHMMRLMAWSRTYRQDSYESAEMRARDPYNQLLARQARFRLPAEMIRDTLLAGGGLLDYEVGGASVKPFQPAGYYRHLNFPKRTYEAHEDHRQWRRGVYIHWQRQFLHPMLAAFDAPSREECMAQRPVSNTPVGALVLLNDPSFVAAAKGLAEQMLIEGGSSKSERLRFGFERVLSRAPDPEELFLLRSLLENDAGTRLSQVDDKRDWILAARAILNLSEAITRF